MKILQINKFFFPKGGSERYFFEVSEQLTAAGHEVSFFSMEDERNSESRFAEYFAPQIDFQGQGSVRKAFRFVHSRPAIKQLRRLIADERPDIAHLHNIAHQLTPSIIRELKKAGIPVVMTLHDYQVMCPNYTMYTKGKPCERCKKHNYWNAIRFRCSQNSLLSSVLSAFEMTVQNRVLKSYAQVDRFIAPSKFMKERMIDWGWPEEKVAYFQHFVEVTRDSSIQKKPQVAFVGRLIHEKGAHLLMEAAAEFPDVEFFFAGVGEERVRLERMAERRDMQNFTFLGFLDAERVERLIQQSQALVVPSLWYENAPLVVYEALALGTPVLAAAHGGLPELIEEKKNGFLFSPGDVKGLAKSLKMLLNTRSFDLPANPHPASTHMDHLMNLYEEIQD